MGYVSLAMMDAPEAAETVVKGLGLGDEDISIAILDSISSIAADGVRDAVRERLGDSSLWVRHHAAALLGEIMDMESEGALINILENDAPPVKAAAAKALAGFASKNALPVLKGIYEGADPSLRAVITRAIEEIQR
jgi:HEAT repeat protein